MVVQAAENVNEYAIWDSKIVFKSLEKKQTFGNISVAQMFREAENGDKVVRK